MKRCFIRIRKASFTKPEPCSDKRHMTSTSAFLSGFALSAALIVAILGTLLNDGGISVWLTATAEVTVVVGWFFFDWAERNDWTPRTAMAEHR